MKEYTHPGLINSSYVVFLVIMAMLISYGMADQFKLWNQIVAALCIFSWSLITILLVKALNQFEDVDFRMISFSIFILLLPPFAGILLNVLIGPLHSQLVPIIASIGLFNAYVEHVPAYPSVFFQYGVFAAIVASWAAFFMERLYQVLSKYLPLRIIGKLKSIDSSIDSKSVAISDNLFFIRIAGGWIGRVVLILQFVLLYFVIINT